MLYTSNKKSFRHHVHPTLQRRLRVFIILGIIMLAVLVYDVSTGTINPWIALISIVFGACVGVFTSRIYHLSWNRDASLIIGKIDVIGWGILIVYIAFETIRAGLFQSVTHTTSSTTAITFAFVSSALISRVFGMRGRIVRILKNENILS